MIFLYFSDETMAFLRTSTAPETPVHVGEFLPVLQEAVQWRESREPNQLAVSSVPVTALHELARTVPYTLVNTPLSEEALSLLQAIHAELDHSVKVEWVTADPELPPVATPAPKPAPKKDKPKKDKPRKEEPLPEES